MYEYKIKEVSKIIDGDTIDVVIDLGFSLTIKTRIRLADIDAPETRTLDLEEKEKGIISKEWLEQQLEGQELVIKTIKPDKYGRILGYIYTKNNPITINEKMVEEGFAVKYYPE